MERITDKQQMISFYNEEAENWGQLRPNKEKRLQKLIEYANIESGMTVLDIGCATGMCAPLCIDKNVKFYQGIDISEQMICRAKKNYPHPKVNFQCGDIEKLNSDMTYNRILIFSVLPHITNVTAFFEKISKLLENDGSICVANYKGRRKESTNRIWSMDEVEILDVIKSLFRVDLCINDEEKLVIRASRHIKDELAYDIQ